MEQRTFTLNVSVLLLKGESGWVAQCLDYDLAAQASTISKAKEAIARTIASQVIVDIEHNQEPLAAFAPAPQEYWDKFKYAERLTDRQPIVVPEGSLPPAFMIRAMADDLRVCA